MDPSTAFVRLHPMKTLTLTLEAELDLTLEE